MRIFFSATSLLFIVLLAFSCDHDKDNDHDGLAGYPMKTGTFWSYDRFIIIDYYESDQSETIIRTDSIPSEVSVTILRDTVLNGQAVKCFGAYDYPATFRSMEYFFEDADGLKCLGYQNPGPAVFARKSSFVAGNLFSFKGLSGLVGIAEDDSPIILEDPPTLNIKYPLKKGVQWTYRYPREGMSLQIDKKAVGEEVLERNGKLYGCVKIEYLYLYSDLYSGMQITDWIAEEGLVQRISVTDRITLVGHEGESLGTVRIREVLSLRYML